MALKLDRKSDRRVGERCLQLQVQKSGTSHAPEHAQHLHIIAGALHIMHHSAYHSLAVSIFFCATHLSNMGNPVITQITLFININEAVDTVHGAGAQHAQLLNQAFGARAIDGNRVTEEDMGVRCSIGGTCMRMRHRYYSNTSADWQAQQTANPAEVAKTLPSGSEVIRSVHISFEGSPKLCFSAPVTEIIFATAKDGQDLITFGGMCDLALRTTIDQPGCTGTAWGFAKENPRVFVLLAGWDVIKVGLQSSRDYIVSHISHHAEPQ